MTCQAIVPTGDSVSKYIWNRGSFKSLTAPRDSHLFTPMFCTHLFCVGLDIKGERPLSRYQHLPLQGANLCHFCFHLLVLKELKYMQAHKKIQQGIDITIQNKSRKVISQTIFPLAPPVTLSIEFKASCMPSTGSTLSYNYSPKLQETPKRKPALFIIFVIVIS